MIVVDTFTPIFASDRMNKALKKLFDLLERKGRYNGTCPNAFDARRKALESMRR